MRFLGFDLTNLTDGGDGRCGPCSAEHRAKISVANTGKRPTDEVRQKMSKAHLGRISPNLGRRWSDEYRKKQAVVSGQKPFKDQNGRIYFTLRDAAAVACTDKANVSRILKGVQRQIKGFTFTYIENGNGH